MDIYYYTLDKTSHLGEIVLMLLDEIRKCDEAADQLAAGLGAVAYLADSSADFGGIAAFEFTKHRILNPKVWEEVPMENTDHHYFLPRVQAREEWMEAAKAAEYEGSTTRVVTKTEVPFAAIQQLFSRDEAAELAGITLTTASLEALGKRFHLPRKELAMVAMGAQPEAALPEADEEVLRELRLSQQEDRQILKAMEHRMFRMVTTLSGNKEAIAIYKEMMELPSIPAGTVNKVLGCESNKYRCGILDGETGLFITSPTPLQREELKPSTAEAFHVEQTIQKAKLNPKADEYAN